MLYSIENKLQPSIFPTDFASKTNTTQRSALTWILNSGASNISDQWANDLQAHLPANSGHITDCKTLGK